MDYGWSFHKGDVADDVVHGYLYTYMQTKTERGKGPASIDFDDHEWEKTDLPHDYVVHERPDPKENQVHGSLKRENAWYRKFFKLNAEDRKKRVTLIFEGICSVCKIWVNGCLMKYNDSAYTEIVIDITDIARFEDDLNVVAVYIDNSEYEAWWYEGAGIYRHVYMDKTALISVDTDGVYVNPQKRTSASWNTEVEITVRNDTDQEADVTLYTELRDNDGEKLGETETEIRIKSRDRNVACQKICVQNPPLWSLERPELCRSITSVYSSGKLLDTYDTIFGFRTIRFDADEGFFLNEKPVKIKGMCIHEDHGGLGTALPDRVKEYRVKRLKEMGCNGYRFSHNPHSRETLDICDRLGMLVMDENRWFESSDEGKRRVEAMVRRDRNHPSVIIWSMGNEEFLQAKEQGKRIMGSLKACVKKLDRTRPVLMAMHTGLLEDGAAAVSDMIGMNYNIELCEKIHRLYPDKPIIFSECSNASEEDVLGNRPAGIKTWKIVDTHSYISGLFAWTGMDYRGEHAYPGLFAPCGAMDQNGYPNHCYYLYQAYWRKEPLVYIQPHWNAPAAPGEKVTVRVFTTGDYVKLYLNGELLKEQKTDPYEMADFEVAYHPGVLKAVAEKQGRFEAECERVTTKLPAMLYLRCETPEVECRESDAAVITVTCLDEDGRSVPDAADKFRVEVKQGGVFLVAGNGNVFDQSDRTRQECSLYKGSAQIIVKSSGTEEDIIVRVVSDTLKAAEIQIPKKPGKETEVVEPQESRYLNHWEVSEWMPEKPQETEKWFALPDTYEKVEIGHGTNMRDLSKNSGYFLYHTQAFMPEHADIRDTRLQFELLEGQSWIFAEVEEENHISRYYGHKKSEEPEEYCMDFGEKKGGLRVEIWVLLHVWMTFCGITKPVRWELGGRYDE